MKKGLVLGKFMPLHFGHVRLVEFAAERSDHLTVLVCSTIAEPIPGTIRLEWVQQYFKDYPNIEIVHLDYDEKELPATSVSSREVSRVWADLLKNNHPEINIIFSSEPYGDFVAEYMNIEHISFDAARVTMPISATMIREHPMKYWELMPENVRPYFTKKICLYGTESTGKSTLVEILAKYYNTNFVPEMARDIIEETENVVPADLLKIASLHAKTILEKIKTSNRILFIDTDVNITASYSRFLFNEELDIPNWISEANQMDDYLFLFPDAPYVQDGTRLEMEERLGLHESHMKQLEKQGINYQVVKGSNWEERKRKAIKLVEEILSN